MTDKVVVYEMLTERLRELRRVAEYLRVRENALLEECDTVWESMSKDQRVRAAQLSPKK